MDHPQAWLKKRLSSIVVATDLHQNSKLALSYAAQLSHLLGSKLSSLYVFEYGPYGRTVEVADKIPSRDRKDAQATLEKFVAGAGYPGIASEVAGDETFVTTAIIKFLQQRSVDLLVIGTEGVHQGIDHLVLGSNTEALMLGSQKLILTVGPQVPQAPEKELHYRTVYYISDFSVASIAAAAYAYAFGEAFGVKIEVCQLASKAVAQEPQRLRQIAAQYCDLLRFSDSNLPSNWYDEDFQLSRIIAEEDLMELALEPSNLLVVGVQPASFLQRHLRTSRAYRLLTNARSPVLTVPAGATLVAS
jgi:nucleotide-binding universal stress UspA family protein